MDLENVATVRDLEEYLRDLGTGFLDAMTSQAVGKISDPRKEVSRILDFFSR